MTLEQYYEIPNDSKTLWGVNLNPSNLVSIINIGMKKLEKAEEVIENLVILEYAKRNII